MFSRAPVALRCTRMSFDLASLVSGTSAPDFAIFVLFSSETRWYQYKEKSSSQRHTMGGQVRDATDGVALYLNIRAQHLPNQRLQST